MNPRIPLACLATRAHCWLMANPFSTRAPRFISTQLTSSRLRSYLCWCIWLFLPGCETPLLVKPCQVTTCTTTEHPAYARSGEGWQLGCCRVHCYAAGLTDCSTVDEDHRLCQNFQQYKLTKPAPAHSAGHDIDGLFEKENSLQLEADYGNNNTQCPLTLSRGLWINSILMAE